LRINPARMNQKYTISQPVSFEGVGLHTGVNSRIVISPSEDGSGIRFRRIDQSDTLYIYADAALVTQTQRGTTISNGEIAVATIEHLLSAIAALGIEDVLVDVNGPEIPILDGSAIHFYLGLKDAGLREITSTKEVFKVQESFEFTDEVSGASYLVTPADRLDITALLSFSEDTMGDMMAKLSNMASFGTEIAPSRTFVFVSDVEKLYDAGLIKGGDLDNAVVIADGLLTVEDIERIRIKLDKPVIDISHEGILNHKKLLFKNEPARHKILDIIGDLALVGRDVHARIIATKPGHTGNVALAKLLKSKYLEYKKNHGRPSYNPNVPPVMTLEDIKSFLPHRFPFLLVDKIIDISPTHIVGIKNITSNEAFFEGHFPGNPIFPGVLQMEALAQTGGILALTTVEDQGQWDTYFLKMDNVKFKAKVVPGDTLVLKMELMMPIRRGIVQMLAHAYVGDKLVSEGELTAQIIKRSND
jgi:UDP-3-O-[3-hydroxymyristoyl] N-acetylglucosamine deacetylase / 3-hydroxyacyl-[acyl-carrier-protein] dehydratase